MYVLSAMARTLTLNDPFSQPYFQATLGRVAGLFAFGFGLVLFFARKDVRAGLKGELGLRYIGWLIIAPLFLAATFIGGGAAVLFLLALCGQVAREYCAATGLPRTYALYLYTLIPVTLAVALWLPGLYFILPAAAILLLSLTPLLGGPGAGPYERLSSAGRGYLYLVWSLGHVLLLQHLGGAGLLLTVAVGAALSDIMQYTVGKLLGRHIIAPHVNPRKAWEGLLGDFLGAGAAVWLFRFALPAQFTLPQLAGLAFVIGLGAAWGDLVSSLIKRMAGVKDWGKIIPGHGGLLDRANSMVIVFPLAYYFTYLVLVYGKP